MPRKKPPTYNGKPIPSAEPISISDARAKLFELVEQVTAQPDHPVTIEHRNSGERAVLVDAERYNYLVSVAHGVLKVHERPFRLYGSMRLNVPEDEFDAWLDENRRTQAELAARKLADL
jgi:prevent-host-death family protein